MFELNRHEWQQVAGITITSFIGMTTLLIMTERLGFGSAGWGLALCIFAGIMIYFPTCMLMSFISMSVGMKWSAIGVAAAGSLLICFIFGLYR
jgi:hypothetical protein